MNLEELKKVVEKATDPYRRVGTDACLRDDARAVIDFNETFNPSLVSKLLRVVEASNRLLNVERLEVKLQDAHDELQSALRDLEQS